MKLSQRTLGIKPSATLNITARTAELQATGQDIVNLATAEADFDTPENARQAGIQAINEGFGQSSSVDGSASLKQAIIDKFRDENGLEYHAGQILVSCGCMHSIYNLIQAVINPEDEVIIPAPYWSAYPDMVRLAGGQTVTIKTAMEQNFKISKGQLRGAITDKTRLLILNSPSNPTGACYTREELESLGEELRLHPDILIATDDIYEHILWSGEAFCNIALACPDLKERTIVLNGVSRAYAMTDWRIGYAAGAEHIIAGMQKLQALSTSHPNAIAQVAAEAALRGPQEFLKERCDKFKQRHDFCLQRLNTMQGVECRASQGGLYIFPNMSGAIKQLYKVSNDIELAEYFLENAGLAMLPGSTFGAPGYMRISFAPGMEILEDAMNRLEKALA